MKKILMIFCLLSGPVHSWDFKAKGDLQRVSTNNANYSSSAPTKDEYTVYSGHIQAKNDSFRWRLKGKGESYKKSTENNYFKGELGLQHKVGPNFDYNLAGFKQTYKKTSTSLTTDTTSDNTGGKLTGNVTGKLDESKTGYFSAGGTYKNYTKFANRKDRVLDFFSGLEVEITRDFLVTPEIAYSLNQSTDSYYENYSYGPSLNFSFMPSEDWEIFFNSTYLNTKYKSRTYSTTSGGRTMNLLETQKLLTFDLGLVYSLTENIPLQAKFSRSINDSNNSSAEYKVRQIGLSIGLDF